MNDLMTEQELEKVTGYKAQAKNNNMQQWDKGPDNFDDDISF